MKPEIHIVGHMRDALATSDRLNGASCRVSMSSFHPTGVLRQRRVRIMEEHVCRKLGEYFAALSVSDNLSFLPSGVNSVFISNVRRLHGSNEVYSFLLTYKGKGFQQSISLILKLYIKDLEPVLNSYLSNAGSSSLKNAFPQLYCEKDERCEKEFQILRSLERLDFAVPRVYLYELDSSFLGSPFIIMKKEKLDRCTDCLKVATQNLIRLHNLDVNALGIKYLKSPEDPYFFARRCLLYFKFLLGSYRGHNKELTRDFDFTLHWLEKNVSRFPCHNYCLIHGDYHIYANTILNESSKIFVLDWEEATVGDPTFDAGYAFVRTWVDRGEKAADRFAQEYMGYFEGDVAERMHFYESVVFLGEAILGSTVLSSPLTAYHVHGINAFLFFPFLHSSFAAKNTGASWDIIWVNCFKEFFKYRLRQ